MKLWLTMMALYTTMTSCSLTDEIHQTLAASGYTYATIDNPTDRCAIYGGDDDAENCTVFEAIAPNGVRVSGVVTCHKSGCVSHGCEIQGVVEIGLDR